MDIASDVKEQSRRLADEQREAGADGVAGVASAIHSAASELEHKMPRAAAYVHDAGDKVAGLATKLKEQSVDDLVGDVGEFARGQPLAFFAGALLAGFTLSRFLKSSNTSP